MTTNTVPQLNDKQIDVLADRIKDVLKNPDELNTLLTNPKELLAEDGMDEDDVVQIVGYVRHMMERLEDELKRTQNFVLW